MWGFVIECGPWIQPVGTHTGPSDFLVFGPLALVTDPEAPPPPGPGSQWWGERGVPNRITAGSADVKEYETRVLNRHVENKHCEKEEPIVFRVHISTIFLAVDNYRIPKCLTEMLNSYPESATDPHVHLVFSFLGGPILWDENVPGGLREGGYANTDWTLNWKCLAGYTHQSKLFCGDWWWTIFVIFFCSDY